MGIDPAPSIIQIDSMDTRLRREVWDTLWLHILHHPESYSSELKHLAGVSDWHFDKYIAVLRDVFDATMKEAFESRIFKINQKIEEAVLDPDVTYDWCCEIIEIFLEGTSADQVPILQTTTKILNEIFERHLFGYRLIEGQLVPVTDAIEIESIEDSSKIPFAAAQDHFKKSLTILSERNSPDPANAIKEAITGLESLLAELVPEAGNDFSRRVQTLGQKYEIHQAMTSSWKSLYGYASSKPGARHGGAIVGNFTVDEAKSVVVTVSSIMNYIISLDSKYK